MGNPKWSYDDMVREADRIITESMKADKNTPIGVAFGLRDSLEVARRLGIKIKGLQS